MKHTASISGSSGHSALKEGGHVDPTKQPSELFYSSLIVTGRCKIQSTFAIGETVRRKGRVIRTPRDIV